MQRIALLVSLFLLSSPAAFSQQTGSIIEWLTTLQEINTRLQANNNATTELRTLHREITAWSTGRSDGGVKIPDFPPGEPSRQQLVDYVANLRGVLEQAERSRPGGAFHAGRIEVNVTASAAQVPTASTLDESDYRMHNLPKTADALNLLPGVTIQRIGPRNERGVYVRGFDFRQVPLYMD
ncbi:MAG: Plug domain-containing protein, partial [Bryobacterales bacterium]|nr:Plug domain-containing protein [Bryobacterales bacterium]